MSDVHWRNPRLVVFVCNPLESYRNQTRRPKYREQLHECHHSQMFPWLSAAMCQIADGALLTSGFPMACT